MVDFLANVENMKPLKEGRAPQVLLQAPMDARKQRSETDVALQRLQNSLPIEPLRAHSEYIKTLKALYPSGSKLINDAIYDAAMYFVENEDAHAAHKNDAKLLNIYLELADKQQNPKDTFVFMRERDVAQQLPKFHLAFASVLERQKDYEGAGASYAEAVYVAQKNAASALTTTQAGKEDLDLATLHHAHFKRRMARRAQEARAINGPRSPMSMDAARGGGRPPMASRQVLGSSSSARAQPMAMQQQQQMKRPAALMSAGGAGPRSGNAQPAFAIYDENQQGKVSAKRPLVASWKTLSTDATSVENHGPAQPWTAANTMPNIALRSTTTAAASTAKKPAFEIYREEEEDEEAGRGKVVAAAAVPSTLLGANHHHADNIGQGEPADERTINSQMAFNDMMDIFGSPRRGGDVLATPMPPNTTQQFMGEEEENVSPNLVHSNFAPPRTVRPGLQSRFASGARSTRRPILAVIEHDEDGVSPSFRRELHFPSAKTERFQVFQDESSNSSSRRPLAAPEFAPPATAMNAASVSFMDEGADVTYDGGTFGISRVLAFDAASASRPRVPGATSATAPFASASARRPMAAPPSSSSGGFAVFHD